MSFHTDQPLDAPSEHAAAPHVLMRRDSFATVAPVYSVKLVQTGSTPLPLGRPQVSTAADVAELLSQYLDGADREHLVAVLLDSSGFLIGVSTIAIGDLTSAIAHPREVFKVAILANAVSIILAHNHPSGEPCASADDLAITKRLMAAGELLGIEVKDHVIVGTPTNFVSIKDNGLSP